MRTPPYGFLTMFGRPTRLRIALAHFVWVDRLGDVRLDAGPYGAHPVFGSSIGF